MIRNVIRRLPVVVLAASLLGCSSSTAEFEAMPELRRVEVACMQVEGLPAFTQATCKDLADRVRQSINEFHNLTGGVVKPPRQVRHRLLANTVEIDDAREIRCINYTGAKRREKDRLKSMVSVVTDTAIEQVNIDPRHTALVVAVNASASLCRKERPPDFTERCPDVEGRRAVLGGQALHDVTGKPVIFIFASPDEPTRDRSLARHEWGHLGIATEQLGHDIALCNRNGDKLPARIDDSTDFGTNIRSREASIMGYSHLPRIKFVAPPHLAQFGLIEKDRILTPKESGIVILGDIPQTGPVAPGEQPTVAALQFELANSAIKKAITSEVAKTKLSVDDYVLFVGTVGAEVAVYATPTPEQLRKSDENTTIFLIKRLSTGEQLDIANGPLIRVLSSHEGVAKIALQLPH
ncbi:MAG TPA: hypothetical protein VFZ58_01450 [Candidatus Saccharimonadales bacterium]